MKRALVLVLVLVLAAACGGPGPNSPRGGGALAKSISDAIKIEQTADTTAAVDAFAKALEIGVAADGDPWQPYVVAAATDHLTMRQVFGLGAHSAIADRLPDPRTGAAKGGGDPVLDVLRKAAAGSKGPFARGLVAWGGQHLAETRGDAKTAAEWRAARGCATEATVIGPLHWAPVSGVTAEADPLEKADAKLEASYAGHGPFAKKIEPTLMKSKGCWIELEAQSALGGVRDVVVDVEVPEAQTIGVGLRTESTATLRVGGRVVIDRPYDLGGDPVMKLARVDVSAGRLRIVARVGADQAGESIAIHVWNQDGMPLVMHAPKPGEAATNVAKGSLAVAPPPVKTDDERVAVGAGALALGEARTAERALFDVASSSTPSANALIVYARAIAAARDLSAARRAERARTLWEKVLERWPSSWEAIVAHAELAGDRKGRSEARIEALRDLDAHRTATGTGIAILDTYDALTSGYESIYDRSAKALERAKPALGSSVLYRDADRAGVARSGRERSAFECDDRSARSGDDLLCYDALADAGDLAKAETEMQRVRNVRGAEGAFLPLSLKAALVRRDEAGAKKIFASMPPGERTFAAFASLEKPTDKNALGRVATAVRDTPGSIAPMLRWLGQEPIAGFEEISDAAVKEDQAKPVMTEAGTAIVRHIERFDVDESGLLHVVLLDVRRVGGTTDVEENAQAMAPDILGKGAMRSLRRRIFKKDGRVLAPDPTPNAAQAHADLAQLEKGDHIESVYEAWALPANSGDLGADTPDMLPERTAIAKAEIEVRLPASLKVNLWSHPLLGKPTETKDGAKRVLTWKLENKPTRRIEEGTPKMDRAARVSWTTAEWANVSRGLREVVAALDDHDVEVESWAKQAGAGKTGRDLVDTIVTKAGETIRESSSGTLSDYMLLRASGPQGFTARTILSDREGSRTLVIMRALRTLGVSVDLGVAENEPFSADPAFPPHFGRFTHPLLAAHVQGKDGKPEDIWIDADVAGPPLPAGRVSPELRGRTVLMTDGKMVPSPLSGSESERDEIDLRIALDDNGDAKGTLTVLLRGRAAQEISEALLKVVGFERERALRNIALAWLPFADIENVVLSSSEGSWQVALRADVSVKKYAQPEGKGEQATWVLPGLEPLHTVFPRPWVTTLSASYAGQGARQEALAISRAVQYHAHRRIELPKSASVLRQPTPLEVRTPSLAASRKLKVEGGALDEEFLLTVTTGTVAADKYAGFVADAQKIDAAFLASTRVKPK